MLNTFANLSRTTNQRRFFPFWPFPSRPILIRGRCCDATATIHTHTHTHSLGNLSPGREERAVAIESRVNDEAHATMKPCPTGYQVNSCVSPPQNVAPSSHFMWFPSLLPSLSSALVHLALPFIVTNADVISTVRPSVRQ